MNNLKCLLLVVSLFVFASCGDDKEEPLPVPSGAVDFTAVADGNGVLRWIGNLRMLWIYGAL